MKKVQWLSVVLIAIMLLGVSPGLSAGVTKESQAQQLLTQQDLIQAFARKGIELVPDVEESAASFTVGGVEPKVYMIARSDQNKERVFVYAFDSWADRTEVMNDTVSEVFIDSELRDMYLPYSHYTVAYTARNLLIVYALYEYPDKPEELTGLSFRAIGNLVFTDLNHGRTIIYRGEGEHWEGQVVYHYFQRIYRDAHGVLHVEGWHNENARARYIGDPFEVGEVNLSMIEPYGRFEATGDIVGSDGFVGLGGGGGSGAGGSMKDIYTCTFEWQGQKETIELKAHPSRFALFFPY